MDKNVLVVDDSKLARRKMCSFLSDFGFELIDQAEDGLDALERFKKVDYDYVFTDLNMPNLNGDIASKEMLKINPNINIILVTSIINKKELANTLNIGVKKVLQKPISYEILKQTIEEIENTNRDMR